MRKRMIVLLLVFCLLSVGMAANSVPVHVGKTGGTIGPYEIKKIMDVKSPDSIIRICKNLGVGEWTGREPEGVEIRRMKLDPRSEPYTVACVFNVFTLRMFVFEQDGNGSYRFLGDMDFRGWPNPPQYDIEKAGEDIWIAGIRYMGHGTGESHYNREYYTVDRNGVDRILCYPYNSYLEGPYSGFAICAQKVEMKHDRGIVRIRVDYDIARSYYLFLADSGEDGRIEMKFCKSVEFTWDEKERRFTSPFGTNLLEETHILSLCQELTGQCDALLEKNFKLLLENILEIPNLENDYERERRAKCYRDFLNECSESMEKSELMKCLGEQQTTLVQ